MVNGKMSLGWHCFQQKPNDMLSKITLGTAQFGLHYGVNNGIGQTTKEEASRILHRCKEVGINHLDTASAYGNAESVIGEILSTEGLDNSFGITTKFKIDGKRSLSEMTLQSLKKLRQNSINTQMFHSYQDYKNFGTFVKPSFVDRIGVSLYTNAELLNIIEDSLVNVIQCPFNLLDNDSVRGSALKQAKEKGIEIHVRSAFLQGLFFMDRKRLPPALKELKGHLEELDRICYESKIPISQLALGYCLSKEYIDKVVIGVDSLEQLDLNIEATKTPIPHPIIEKIDKIIVTNQLLLNPTNW